MTGKPAGDHGQRFVSYLLRARPLVEDKISAILAERLSGASTDVGTSSAIKADLSRYLYGPLASFTESGGKRIRPVLCLLGAEAVGGDGSRALSSAAAIELFQSAALIHDDIADEGRLRRGQPCLHVREGTGIAINVGDLALVRMFACVTGDVSLDPSTRLAVLCELAAMSEHTLEGQALDLGWVRDGRWDLGVDDYVAMAINKTAHYSLATPLVCGALCGGGDAAQRDALRSFGIDVGLAFQLQDDVLNLIGDADAQGKDYRSDITEGKRTLIAVHALSELGPSDAAELASLLSSGVADEVRQRRAVELMERAGSIAYVTARASQLVAQAKQRLTGACLESQAVETLMSMADYCVERAR